MQKRIMGSEMEGQIHGAVGSQITPVFLPDFVYSYFTADESEAQRGVMM